jgi:protein-L-isoaspartate(D-aspartate) O-methyltransferase
VLAELVGERNVHAVDITRRLVIEARGNLADSGYGGVLVDRRDGADGLPEYAPYDRILLEAAAVSPPTALVEQLTDEGRLVMPLGAGEQTLVTVERASDGAAGDRAEAEIAERLGGVAFQPMLVEGEQADTVERNRTRREDREHARRNAQARAGWEQDWIEWDGR